MRRAIDVTILHLQLALQDKPIYQPGDLDLLKPGLLYGDHVHLFTPNNWFIESLRESPDWERQPLERKLNIARGVAKALAENEELNAKIEELKELNAKWPADVETLPVIGWPDMARHWPDVNAERYAHYLRTGEITGRDARRLKEFDSFLETVIDAMLGVFRNELPGTDHIIRLMQSGLVSLYPLNYADDLVSAPGVEFTLPSQQLLDYDELSDVLGDENLGNFLTIFAKRMRKIWDTPNAFPFLDGTLGYWAQLLSSQHPAAHGRGSGRQKELPLAGEFFGQLPGFQRATVDELLDIRKELHDSLQRFRLALAKISEELTDSSLSTC
jgi:hypothetical protein